MGSGRKGSVDRFGLVLFSDAIIGGKGAFQNMYCLREGGVAFFLRNEQLGDGRRQAGYE